MNQPTQTNETILCIDKYVLASTVFSPNVELKGAILIAPATGIKRQFYTNFATYLAQHGYGVLCFDYRGIGGSLTGEVKQSKATLQCWGEKDMPAALEHLKRSFPNTNYHLIGHSAGGQLVGLMNNARELTSMFNVACSLGQISKMRISHKLKAHFFMNLFIPFSNALFGHTKSQWVGMGEPLPKSVAMQWSDWCTGEGYVKEAFGKTVFNHLYNELTMPSLWINAIDDEIANSANLAGMLSILPKIHAQTLTLVPKDYNLPEIGHMKFFSRKSQTLWSYALNWLENPSTT